MDSDIIGRLEIVGAWCAGVGGVLLAVWRRGAALVRTCRAVCNLHAEFGDRPGDKLATALRRGEIADGETRIRQATLEAFAGLGVFNCDAGGACTWVNDELAELFGLDPDKMFGFGWTAAIAATDRVRVVDEWRRAVELGLPYSSEYTVENQRTGERVDCVTWVRSVEIFDETNRTERVVLFYVGAVIRRDDAAAFRRFGRR